MPNRHPSAAVPLPIMEALELRSLRSAGAAVDVPAVPGDLVGVARPGTFVRLAFTDNSTDETGFVVEYAFSGTTDFYRKVTVPPSAPGEAGTRIFVDPGGLTADTYRFRVRAENDAGLSEPSNTVTVVTFGGPSPRAAPVYFYNDRSFGGEPVVRDLLPLPESDFGDSSPAPGIDPDTFSGVFEGYLKAEFGERYTFHTGSGDGIALRVVDPRDGRVLVDFDNLAAVRDLPPRGVYQDVAGSADLEQGVSYLVTVRFNDETGDAGYRVGWSSFSTPLEGVPANLFRPLVPGGPHAAIRLSGSNWTDAFLSGLAARGLGDRVGGFPLANGGPGPLPWVNLNQVTASFDRPARVVADDLAVEGERTDYAVSAFAPVGGRPDLYRFTIDPLLGTGTDGAAGGRVSLQLDSGPAGITSMDGVALDGDSDGRPGGDAVFSFDVLPGDATRDGTVNALDLAEVRRRLNKTGADPTRGPTSYSPFADVVADGRINSLDLAVVKRRLNTRLQVPTASFASAAPLPPVPVRSSPARELFASAPVIG